MTANAHDQAAVELSVESRGIRKNWAWFLALGILQVIAGTTGVGFYFSEGLASLGIEVPRPAGFPSHEETIERYAQLIGRPLHDLFYYEVFSGFRFAVVMYRLAHLLAESDAVSQEGNHPTNNLATQFLAVLLDLEPPA